MADGDITTGTPAPDGSARTTRPGGRAGRSLSADAAAAAEAAAIAEAAALGSGTKPADASTTTGPIAADAGTIEPPPTGQRPERPNPDGGRPTTSKGLVGVFPTNDGRPTPTSSDGSSIAAGGATIDPEGIELLATKPFAIEPPGTVHEPTPPPTAWRAATTSSVLAAILPPMTPADTTVHDTGFDARATVATTPPPIVEAPPVIVEAPPEPQPVAPEAGPPAVSALVVAPVEPITPLEPIEPAASEAAPTEAAPGAEPARDASAAAAGLGLVAILGPTEATPSGAAPWAIATLPATAPARPPDVDPPRPTPAARSAAVPIAMAPAVAVTVGAWPTESTAPDGLIGTSLPVGRPSRVRRRALLLVLLLVVFAAGSALFFAAASGSLDRFLPAGLLSQQVVAMVETVGRLIRPG